MATQRRGMFLVILAQCFGGFSSLVFQRGMVLLYLLALGIPESRNLSLHLTGLHWLRPRRLFRHLADRKASKRVGTPGLVLGIIGMALLPAAVLLPTAGQREMLALVGVVLYSFGGSTLAGTWFPLLRLLIPEHLRGRFFGTLRFSWQLVGVAFISICAAILNADDSVETYAMLLIVVVIGLILRLVVYCKIPELQRP